MELLRASRIVTLDERKDVLLRQLVWILGLLGVTHMEAISPLPEEPAIVAGTVKGWGRGSQCCTCVVLNQETTHLSVATMTFRMSVKTRFY